MALTNKSIFAILGILNIAPSTGYDIKKYCDNVLSGFWNENFGHIYPTLKKMTEDGYIEIIPGEEGDKKICYGITSKGKECLNTWLVEESTPSPVRSEFMLKLIFSADLPNEQIRLMLEKYKQEHIQKKYAYEKLLKELEIGLKDVSDRRQIFLKSVLRRGLLSAEATCMWCDETIAAFS